MGWRGAFPNASVSLVRDAWRNFFASRGARSRLCRTKHVLGLTHLLLKQPLAALCCVGRRYSKWPLVGVRDTRLSSLFEYKLLGTGMENPSAIKHGDPIHAEC